MHNQTASCIFFAILIKKIFLYNIAKRLGFDAYLTFGFEKQEIETANIGSLTMYCMVRTPHSTGFHFVAPHLES